MCKAEELTAEARRDFGEVSEAVLGKPLPESRADWFRVLFSLVRSTEGDVKRVHLGVDAIVYLFEEELLAVEVTPELVADIVFVAFLSHFPAKLSELRDLAVAIEKEER
jgi:hypothetical protein